MTEKYMKSKNGLFKITKTITLELEKREKSVNLTLKNLEKFDKLKLTITRYFANARCPDREVGQTDSKE